MTEERLKEIYRDVSHSAHEEMSTDNIHLMAMRQAVNEAIEAYRKQCEDNSFSDGKTEFILMDDINRIAEKLKIK